MTHPDVSAALEALLTNPSQLTQQEVTPVTEEPMTDARLSQLEAVELDASIAVQVAKNAQRLQRQTDAQKNATSLNIMRRANGLPALPLDAA